MDTIATSRKGIVFYLQQIIGFILLLALAATFFYSAYTKSGIQFSHFKMVSNDNAFDSFQWTFLDLGFSNIILVGIIARVMIGFELVLGLFLLFHIYVRRFTYGAVISILSIFIIYLLIVIAKQGNSGNCGCFGNKLEMTPLAAIWKNIAMIAATVLLWLFYPPKPKKIALADQDGILLPEPGKSAYKQYQYFVGLFLATIAFSLPFLVNFINIGTDPDKFTGKVNFDPLYKYDNAPAIELRTGKHIIAFMSLTCPHCRKAAYLFHIIHREHPDIPIYLVLDGPDAYRQKFFDETHAEDVPYLLYYHHSPDFAAMAGPGVPSIYWVNNGVVEYKSTYAYYQLDPDFMESWLKKP